MPLCHFGTLSIVASFPLFYAAHEPILTEPDGLNNRRHPVVRRQLPIAGQQQKVPDTGGVYLVPAFTGMGAPYWDMYARGILVGLTRGTGREHIIRAALESIAFQSADLMAAMEKDTGVALTELRTDGGASRNNFLMQFQADVLDKKVCRSAIGETTALGAAYLAGLAAGVWRDTEELRDIWSADRVFVPELDTAHRERILRDWHRAVERSAGWAG